MPTNKIQLEAGRMDMTPYYMARMACDIFGAAKPSHPKAQWSKYLLYCIVIEVGLKAILLNNNNTVDQKFKNIGIGHNLTELRTKAAQTLPDGFFSATDARAIDEISPFFNDKCLEYVSSKKRSLLGQIMNGCQDLPEVADLEAVAEKVIHYVEAQSHFRHSNTYL